MAGVFEVMELRLLGGNYMKRLILLFCVAVTVLADDAPVRRLVDHFNEDGKIAAKKGLKNRPNEDRGYLVQITGTELISKTKHYYVYKSTVLLQDDSIMGVILNSTPELDLEIDHIATNEQKRMNNFRKLAQEGGSSGALFSPLNTTVSISVLARPAGIKAYVHPDGSRDSTLAFDVEQVCDREFRACRKIKEHGAVGGFLKNLFGK